MNALVDIAPAAPSASLREAAAWTGIDGTWKPLYGSFDNQGVSVEWHDFSNAEEIDWSRSFHPESLEVCLNFSGHGSLGQKKSQGPFKLGPEQVALTTTGNDRVAAERTPGHMHRFLTVELSAAYLRAELASVDRGTLLPEVGRFLDDPARAKPAAQVVPMVPALLAHRLHLVEPPVGPAARPLWYQSKIVEALSHLLFRPAEAKELFCHRQRRVNRERCERVLFLLERDLENPPSLDMLAKEVGCSPFYLSRLFAQETGGSIPKYLRHKRVEKAAEYLRSGRMNVTEAAFAVGYSSLSSFNKAFVDQYGCCPGLYPCPPHLVRRPRAG